MSTSAPIPLIQNGLVFSYDTYNSKSYRGEPTTNLVTNADTMASWSAYDNGNDGTFITEFGTTGYRMINRGSWNGIYKGITLNSTGNHTFSAYIRYWGGASNNNGGTVYTSGFGVSDSATGVNKNLIGVWQRITLTINATSTSGTLYLISFGGTYNGDKSTWEVTMPQVEKNTHTTQFTNGTRSNTDSLLDLNRTATFNLSGTSFDTGANITFTGTSNISLGPVSTYLPTTAITVNTWVRPNVVNSGYKKIFGTYTAGTTTIQGIYFSIGSSPYNTYFGLLTTGGSNYATYAQDISTTKHTNLCGTYDGAIIKLYANGVLVATQAHTGTIGNGGIGRISGYDNNTEIWDGNIDVVSMYNRALTQSEILQNYNSAKSRFGL